MKSLRPAHPTLALAVSLLALAAPLWAQDEAAAQPPLVVTAVEVEPANPGPETLCRLSVTVRNNGDQQASQLGFSVRLNGEELAVYGNQLFMYAVPAGGELKIPLYNFWTTESSRPTMPADGKYRVDVSLLEAQWMDISTITESVERGGKTVDEEVEVWNPLGPVEGLSASLGVVLDSSP